MTAIAMRKLSGINCFLLGIVRHIALNKSLSNNECNNFGSACDSYIVLCTMIFLVIVICNHLN